MEYPLKIQNAVELLSIFVEDIIKCFINSDLLSQLATKLGQKHGKYKANPLAGITVQTRG